MNEKTDKIRFFPKDSVTVEATDWVTELKSESLSPEREAQFYEWVAENPENKLEVELMDAIWDYSIVFKEHPLVIADMAELASAKKKRTKGKWLRIPQMCWTPMFKITVAVSVLLIVLGVWLIRDQPDLSKTYQTAAGEQETVLLADGSSIHLDAKTIVAIAFSVDSRKIELKSGRAIFSVYHDPERPFVVLAGDVFVQAIGTEFQVYKRSKGRVGIVVTEGRVQIGSKDNLASRDSENLLKTENKKTSQPQKKAIERTDQSELPVKIVGPGQRVIVDEQKQSTYVEEAVDIQGISAWRYGKLHFTDTPLETVIEELNRYLDYEIVIGDRRLDDIRVTTVFKLKDHKYFITTLGAVVPVLHKKSSNGQVVLYRREDT